MSKEVFPFIVLLVLGFILLNGCVLRINKGGDEPITGIPNPSAEYCIDQGNRYEIITHADDSQTGNCILKDGTVCDGWAYYKGSCREGGTTSDPGGEETCKEDSDCVPAECCHPTTCTPTANKRPCNLMCTEECRQGTLDCGQGSCKCIDYMCEAVYK